MGFSEFNQEGRGGLGQTLDALGVLVVKTPVLDPSRQGIRGRRDDSDNSR